MTSISFTGIRKTFGATVALESLDLDLQPGELVSLLGPSGCGKTTALRIAAGFEVPDAGIVSLSHRDITRTPAHQRNMGMVFQSYSLFPNLTVAQNIEFGLRNRKIEKAKRLTRVGEMLELIQLDDLGKRYPHQLSGGQQQRVALARALAVQPEVLLLDEPLSALDAKVRSTLRDEIRRIQTELKTTTLFVTHDQEEALAISDRIGVMSNGQLEQLGTPEDVYLRPASPFVARFVGSINELPNTNGSGQILVRPEDVTISTDEDELDMRGTTTRVTFQGPVTIISVRVDVVDLLVNVHAASGSIHTHVGDRVSLAVAPGRGIVEAA
ncbi:MAG: ABC transporter ATP-binding protein [Ilumatobacteraceae bacterium]|jgi:putative spermidine/putrescine transport system ATP-binding protein|nr:ABC transporter ATP-binding protein [Ilumatobacteraceae bacterium]MBJ7509600.1 ABC transporter ATP-binding protein [Ilumatobacteraceae bacterium]